MGCMDNSSILACLDRSVSSHQILLNFLAILCLIVSEEVYSSFPILHASLFCLFEPDQPMDSLVVAVIVGTRTPDSFQKAIFEFLFSQRLTSTSA